MEFVSPRSSHPLPAYNFQDPAFLFTRRVTLITAVALLALASFAFLPMPEALIFWAAVSLILTCAIYSAPGSRTTYRIFMTCYPSHFYRSASPIRSQQATDVQPRQRDALTHRTPLLVRDVPWQPPLAPSRPRRTRRTTSASESAYVQRGQGHVSSAVPFTFTRGAASASEPTHVQPGQGHVPSAVPFTRGAARASEPTHVQPGQGHSQR